MNKQHLIQEFDKYVKELKQLDYPYRDGDTETVYFGYKTNRNNEIFTVTDWGNVRKFVEKVYASAKREVIEEVLKMKQEAYNEQEAITFDMLNDIVYMGAVPPDAPRKVRNLQFVKVYDIVKYAVKNGISLKEKSELSAKSEEK